MFELGLVVLLYSMPGIAGEYAFECVPVVHPAHPRLAGTIDSRVFILQAHGHLEERPAAEFAPLVARCRAQLAL